MHHPDMTDILLKGCTNADHPYIHPHKQPHQALPFLQIKFFSVLALYGLILIVLQASNKDFIIIQSSRWEKVFDDN